MVTSLKAIVAGAVTMGAVAAAANDYPHTPAVLTNVSVTGGFWLPRFETNRLVTLRTDFEKCETARIPNIRNAAARRMGTFQGIPHDDSDVFKVIEGAAYTLAMHPDAKLEAYVDDLNAAIAASQEPDGYLYTARTLGFWSDISRMKRRTWQHQMMGSTRWSNLAHSHELYNIGHLYEAAVAYWEATGKRTLLDVAIRSADLVARTFGPEPTQLKDVPGHQEIELALCRLYRATGNERYLTLARFFLDQRGKKRSGKSTEGDLYLQDHLPVVAQREAVGHAVRATYLYCGMADVAALTGDASYMTAINAIWQNVVAKKLHLNGSIGARRRGEAFGANYELPNETAYLETCAGIGNALWNHRLFLCYGEGKYIDVLERALYNGILSGVSLDGAEFFYPNPLASKGGYKRSKWFNCSCCPVNIVRLIPQIVRFAYATRENAAYVNLFLESRASLALSCGQVTLTQKTDYPWAGDVRLCVAPPADGARFSLHLRVPGWCVGSPVPSDLYTYTRPGSLADYTVTVNGERVAFTPEKGYCVLTRAWKKGDTVAISMKMPVRRVKAHTAVAADRGRLAVERGPVLYCAEAIDNGGSVLDKVLPADAPFTRTTCRILGHVFPAFTAPAFARRRTVRSESVLRPVTLTLVPYFAWCHRGAGEMQTWFPTAADGAQEQADCRFTASFCHAKDAVAALGDGILPKSSDDGSIRRFTFWDHCGTEEWVQCTFNQPEEVRAVDVYWFDDGQKGHCRVPASWRVQWRPSADAPWRDIDAACPVAKDRFCSAVFPNSVKAQALRLAVSLQKGWSGGILEWRFR